MSILRMKTIIRLKKLRNIQGLLLIHIFSKIRLVSVEALTGELPFSPTQYFNRLSFRLFREGRFELPWLYAPHPKCGPVPGYGLHPVNMKEEAPLLQRGCRVYPLLNFGTGGRTRTLNAQFWRLPL